MKTFVRAIFLFTSLHFVIFFLCGVTFSFQRLVHAQNQMTAAGGFSIGVDYLFHLLSLPLGPYFWKEDAALPILPLFILLANSFIWGIALALCQALLESARDSGSEKPLPSSGREPHVSFPMEVIFLFIILTLVWSALSFLDFGFSRANNQNILVSYLRKLAVFPTVPLFLPEKSFQEMAFLGDLPVVLLNMVLWSVLLAVLLRVLRYAKKEDRASQ